MNAPDLVPVDATHETHSMTAFRKGWMDANLPPMGDWSGKTNYLLVELRDKLHREGPTYTVPMPPAYQDWYDGWFDADDYFTLQHYFYADHFCDCHRKTEVSRLPNHPSDLDYACNETQRFVVQRIYSPAAPNVTLYSETDH